MARITRRAVLAGGAAIAAGPAWARREAPPSFLVLLPDQLRASALSLYGEENIQTEVFDRLLSDGVHFGNSYSADPMCAPARAALWTGRYPHANRVIGNGHPLPPSSVTLSTVLSAAGWRCGYIGKWHLDKVKTKPGYVPPDRRFGFRYWAGFNMSHAHSRPVYYTRGAKERRPPRKGTWEPDLQVDLALDFLKKNRRRPFFLVVSFGPPHPPTPSPVADWGPGLPPGALDRVDKDRIRTAPNVPAWMLGPNRGPDGTAPEEPGARHHMQGYYASILALERPVQRLIAGLDALDLGDKTVVVLTSDHGEMGGAHGQYKKGEPYEESVRVPLGFRWKGRIAPRHVPAFTSGVDLMPTLLRLAGVKAKRSLHGEDLSPWLRGEAGPDRKAVLVQGRIGHVNEWRMIRTRDHSYAERLRSGDWHLWEMRRDPFQLHDLSQRVGELEVRTELSTALADLRTSVDDRSAS